MDLKGHLPRLAPEYYRGHAFVHWTLTINQRATGWLTPAFNHAWQLTLLHACARYNLACPAYVLMPDHAHLIWLGLTERDSDQRVAIEFLQKHLRLSLAPADWQRQPFDHVLLEHEREHGAFSMIANYILNNPVRARVAASVREWSNLGCCVPGYPSLDPRTADYWPLTWRIYSKLIAPP